LFIHGLGSTTRDWESQVKEFSATHKVITFDVRGHGQSDKPPGPYTMSMFASDIAGLMKALGIESADVVGLSLGGGIAFALAVEYPRLVRRMVIVNSAPELVVRSLKDRVGIWQRFAIVQVLGMRRMGEVLSKRLFPEASQEALRATFVERWAENDPHPYQDAMRSMVGWSVADRLGEIKCPTLVVAAEYDYTPISVKQAYAKRMPDARVAVIAGAHHATPVEKPAEFNAVLREFLS
jgi:pimeloyl-ACP methyl ester carboxylesterase